MPIEVDCPNGHHLKIKDKYAGQTGLCPKCQARVLVPAAAGVNEDEVLDWMGPPPANDDMAVHQESRQTDGEEGGSLLGSSILRRGTKTCKKCRKTVPQGYKLCPHCQTYFTDVTEVARRMAAPCPACGKELEVGATWCTHCGADLHVH